MNQSNRKYWWSCLLVTVLFGFAPSSEISALQGFEGEFRDFCVGSSCDPVTLPLGKTIQQSEDLPLLFSVSINFDEVTAAPGTGFTFLDVLDDQGQQLLKFKAVRAHLPGQGILFLSLEYSISPGLIGTLPLGYSVGGIDCFWVERTPSSFDSPLTPGIRVTRSGSGQDYDTGNLHIMVAPTEIRQGVLELFGEPSGIVSMSDTGIDKKCGS